MKTVADKNPTHRACLSQKGAPLHWFPTASGMAFMKGASAGFLTIEKGDL